MEQLKCDNLPLDNDDVQNDSVSSQSIALNMKKAKKVRYFSDGKIEEFSDDENELLQKNTETEDSNDTAKSMALIPYITHSLQWIANKTLDVCDYFGENLAHFFGITSPKYQSEIEEYLRRVNEEKHDNEEIEEEFSGWKCDNSVK